MGTIKADTVTGLADPNKATIPNTITMGSTTATLNFGNTVIANTSAGSTTITAEGGTNTTNIQQGLLKGWLNFKGDGTVENRDSLNFSTITDSGTGIYELNITNNMANINYHFNPFHRSNSRTSGIANLADQETGKIDDHKTFSNADTLIDRELGGGLIAGDLA